MKLKLFITALLFAFLSLLGSSLHAQKRYHSKKPVHVSGYTKKNGIYVSSHTVLQLIVEDNSIL